MRQDFTITVNRYESGCNQMKRSICFLAIVLCICLDACSAHATDSYTYSPSINTPVIRMYREKYRPAFWIYVNIAVRTTSVYIIWMKAALYLLRLR